MKNSKFYLCLILAAGMFISCEEEEEVSPQITEEQAVAKATSMTSAGTVTSKSTSTTTEGDVYYEIDITTSEAAVIEFEYFQATGELKEIEGDNGPFNYEVTPGMGLKTFSQAKAAALAAQSGDVISWSLEKNSSSGNWEYKFTIIDSNQEDFTVRINASTGAVIGG